MNEQREDAAFPLVTVAMPIYNAGELLRLAVLSIVRQTYQNWELLIIDDGSTDAALDGIADIQDNRIRMYRDGCNKGLAARLNECIGLARGRYFARMDQDDVSFPERFAKQVARLQTEPALDVLAVVGCEINAANEIVGMGPVCITHEQICARPWLGIYMMHPTWMGKIEWFREHLYASPAPFLCEDQELLLRTCQRSRFETINEVLFAYRIREKIDLVKLWKTRFSVLKVQCKHFFHTLQLHYFLLAICACLVKGGGDFLKFVSPPKPRGQKRNIHPDVLSWHAILSNLTKGD